MDNIELCKWCLSHKNEVDEEIGKLAKEADPKKLPLFRKLLKVNNALTEVFWAVMIYRERCGLAPLAYPYK